MTYVLFAAIVTGDGKYATCHPEAVSLEKVTVARFVPVEDHRLPTWVPVLLDSL